MRDIAQVNAATPEALKRFLAGLYEHSDWIVEKALADRPFCSVTALQQALIQAVNQASREQQLALICAHPTLTGKAKIDSTMALDSQSEQSLIGLDRCSAQEFEALNTLNLAYQTRFGWPFIIAVKGPRGSGLTRQQIIENLQNRLLSSPEREFEECLAQIHRIAQCRLNERMGLDSAHGQRLWDHCAALAPHPDILNDRNASFPSPLTQASGQDVRTFFLQAGFDSADIDAKGNTIGRYAAVEPSGRYLLTGGNYADCLGFVIPIDFIHGLVSQGRRLAFGIEVVAFAEQFTEHPSPHWSHKSLNAQALIDASRYIGYVEIAPEQGHTLARQGHPLGIAKAIEALPSSAPVECDPNLNQKWIRALKNMGQQPHSLQCNHTTTSSAISAISAFSAFIGKSALLVRAQEPINGQRRWEAVTSDDMALAAQAFAHFCVELERSEPQGT